MSDRNRFAVPVEQLDGVRIARAEQVEAEAAPAHPYDAATWGGALAAGSRAADGGGGGTDGDGE